LGRDARRAGRRRASDRQHLSGRQLAGVPAAPHGSTTTTHRTPIGGATATQEDTLAMSNATYDFNGQVALVTGAGSGMGLVTAQAFAEAGAAVVLTDIDEAALRTATDALTTAGHQAVAVSCDVTDEAQVATAVQQAVAKFGRLDMAFNNAGIQVPPSDAADETAENFDRVNAINLRGVWASMKHELRQMREQGSGAIVNCSSLGGLVGLPSRAAYHASKHGVSGLTRSAAMESPSGSRACSSRRPRSWIQRFTTIGTRVRYAGRRGARRGT
jgi:NADP-dependent 3-hydroxy acid dehydrogenase YdfG